MMENSDRRSFPIWLPLVIIGSVILVLFLVIFLPISFSYLDFYHSGLVRGYISGRVNIDRVYTGGLYLVGPLSQ